MLTWLLLAAFCDHDQQDTLVADRCTHSLRTVDLASKGLIPPNSKSTQASRRRSPHQISDRETSELSGAVRSRRNQPECIYTHPDPPTNLPSVMFPLYHHWDISYNPATGECTDDYFLEVARGCRSVLAVVNPGDGPVPWGTKSSKGLKACMMMLGENGVQMVGYVFTKIAKMDPATGVWTTSGLRPVGDFKRDVNNWADHYADVPGFNGIFLDDTSNYWETTINRFGANHISHYRKLINYVKQKLPGGIAVLNPGSFVHLDLLRSAKGFPSPGDISIPFEDYAHVWRPPGDNCRKVQWNTGHGTWGPGPWCPAVPDLDHVEDYKAAVESGEISVAAVIHSGSWTFASREAETAQKSNFRYFFATDRKLVNDPWIGVPSFWRKYLQYLNDSE